MPYSLRCYERSLNDSLKDCFQAVFVQVLTGGQGLGVKILWTLYASTRKQHSIWKKGKYAQIEK